MALLRLALAEVEFIRDEYHKQKLELMAALECWPLKELLGAIEDSGDEAQWRRAQWFMEVRDAALARAPTRTNRHNKKPSREAGLPSSASVIRFYGK